MSTKKPATKLVIRQSLITAKTPEGVSFAHPMPKDLEEPKLLPNAIVALEKRYLLKDKDGKNVETIKEMFWRVASAIAWEDEKYDKSPWKGKTKELAKVFYKMMIDGKFLPNSPTLMNAGVPNGQLSACFVLPVEDSMEGIFDAVKNAALIHKCLHEDTPINTTTGVKAIKDLKEGDFVFDRNGIPRKVLELIPTGEKEVYELITMKGHRVICSEDHKFLTGTNYYKGFKSTSSVVEFKTIKHITENIETCKIAIANPMILENPEHYVKIGYTHPDRGVTNMKIIRVPEYMDEELAWFLGYFIGNGSEFSGTVSIDYHGIDSPEIGERLIYLANKLFDCDITIRERKGTAGMYGRIHSKMLSELLAKHILCGKKHHIPSIIKNSPNSVKWAFISGIFDADGTVKQGGNFSISTSDETLAKDLMWILNSVGMRTGYRREHSYHGKKDNRIQCKDNFTVRPLGTKSYDLFVDSSILFNQKKRNRFKKDFKNMGVYELDGMSLVNVRSVKKVGTAKTYNITVQDVHEYCLTDGFVSKNSGGGTGFSFSKLRASGAVVGSTGGVASGPISFMKVFDTATAQVMAGGKRRGANMGILRVDHPDVEKFIACKGEDGQFSNFNISVAVTDKFMQAVECDGYFDLINPHDGSIAKVIKAKELFDALVKHAWGGAEPGVIFLDEINRHNPTPEQGEVEATNPCGEIALLPNSACNLGSINLSKFVPSYGSSFNIEDFENTIKLAVRFLDNVIDASVFPLPQIDEMVRKNRQLGLGVMGFADMLFKHYLEKYPYADKYDSKEARELAADLFEKIKSKAKSVSIQLAEERGVYPASIEPHDTSCQRNTTLTAIAPTGTLSLIAGCSSGIEPIFALAFEKHILDGQHLIEVNPYFERAIEANYDEATVQKIKEHVAKSGTCQNCDLVSDELKAVFVTAMDISPKDHVLMQAAFQKHVDNAISKTINMPHDATIQDVHDAYMLAYKTKCKGITVYRDGCKSIQVLYAGTDKKDESPKSETPAPEKTDKEIVKKRPDIVQGFTQKVPTGLGVMYLTVNEIDGVPFEVFATIGKSGRSVTAKAEAIGRLVSLALRSGIPVSAVVNQIKGIGGEHPVFKGKGLLLSIPDAISSVLESRYMKAGEAKVAPVQGLTNALCPDCGSELVLQEGCNLCPNCGFSKCGG